MTDIRMSARTPLRSRYSVVVECAILLSFSLTAQPIQAQNEAVVSPQLIALGRKLFGEQCSACHGTDAQGSDRAPKLAGSRTVRARSVEQLRNVISHGIPAAGMPAFNLPANDLNALAAYVHSLNPESVQSSAAGDPSKGRVFFFGKGGCATCHMVHGRGEPTGPDLSNSGARCRRTKFENNCFTPGRGLRLGTNL